MLVRRQYAGERDRLTSGPRGALVRATLLVMSTFDRQALKRMIENGRASARRAGERVLEPLQRAIESGSALEVSRNAPLSEPAEEPPVVARLIVEIRSDGSRTIARGGLEDLTTGEKVAVRADGTSPAQLARSLASTLVTLPVFAARIARSLKRGEPDKTND
jgi:hypothetical protein